MIAHANSQTFSLVFDGQDITVNYRANYFSGYDHFEFVSPYEPPRPIPSSETGYRSYFEPSEDVLDSKNCIAHAYQILTALTRSLDRPDDAQLKLFE